MTGSGISRRNYAISIMVILLFEWTAFSLAPAILDGAALDHFLAVRLIAIAIGYIAIFWATRSRLAQLNMPVSIAFVCLVAFFFTPQFLLFVDTQISVPAGVQKAHFWFSVPIAVGALFVVIGLLFRRSKEPV